MGGFGHGRRRLGEGFPDGRGRSAASTPPRSGWASQDADTEPGKGGREVRRVERERPVRGAGAGTARTHAGASSQYASAGSRGRQVPASTNSPRRSVARSRTGTRSPTGQAQGAGDPLGQAHLDAGWPRGGARLRWSARRARRGRRGWPGSRRPVPSAGAGSPAEVAGQLPPGAERAAVTLTGTSTEPGGGSSCPDRLSRVANSAASSTPAEPLTRRPRSSAGEAAIRARCPASTARRL